MSTLETVSDIQEEVLLDFMSLLMIIDTCKIGSIKLSVHEKGNK